MFVKSLLLKSGTKVTIRGSATVIFGLHILYEGKKKKHQIKNFITYSSLLVVEFLFFFVILTTWSVFPERDLQKNDISWTIEDMNGPFSALDKLKRL